MVTSIMIVGVGGQGSLLASKLLGRAAMDKGYDVIRAKLITSSLSSSWKLLDMSSS